ncbi:MAG TPA: IS3 family transposase [Acidimicrobiales bacterium]|nr:IS3 family transposase [Acidimicrobiales bacterium]
MAKGYGTDLRREALGLVRSGRSVRAVANELGVSVQAIYSWKAQEVAGARTGLSLPERDELVYARRRIAVLEEELAATRQALELIRGVVPPKVRFRVARALIDEGVSVHLSTKVAGVSQSGFFAWRNREPSPRSLRHAELTELIRSVYRESQCTYGARRVHSELCSSAGIAIARSTVELLMSRAGMKGRPGKPRTPSSRRGYRPMSPPGPDGVIAYPNHVVL